MKKNELLFRLSTTVFLALMLPTTSNAGSSDSWRQFDKDSNDALSLEEFSTLRVAQYAALDRNGDGHWTKREFVKREPDMTIGRIDSLRKKFNRWDLNEDGKWDTSEASKAIKGNFRWLDKNKNKAISIKEFPRFW